MIYLYLIFFIFLSNKSLRLIDRQIQQKKIDLLNYNISNIEYDTKKSELQFLELNRYRIIIQEKLD